MTQKTSKRKQCVDVRPPTGKKGVDSTLPPLISIGGSELLLLRYVYNHSGERFNRSRYARDNQVPKSTVKSQLNSLISKGLLEETIVNGRVFPGQQKITTQGKQYVESTYEGVESLRRECRTGARDNLSAHYMRFDMPIESKTHFHPSRLRHLNPIEPAKSNPLPNFTQWIVKFDDASITINLNRVYIRVHDILSHDVEEATYLGFSKAIRYVKKLSKIGLIGAGLKMEQVHYARVRSVLSDCLAKIDDRYYLDLGDGRKFWIDNSEGKREDETNDYEVRERYDEFFTDLVKSNSKMTDVDKVIEGMGLMLKMHALTIQPHLNQMKTNEGPAIISRPDYVG
jgi:hypothetical protein